LDHKDKKQHIQASGQASYAAHQLVLIWVIGAVLCTLVGLLTIKVGLTHAQEEFQAKADLVNDEITRRYSTLEAVLTALAGFHQASEHVSDVQFSIFAEQLLNAYPYIRSAMSLHLLEHSDRTAFETEMQDRGYFQFSITETTTDGRIRSAASREEYLVVKALEPLLPNMGSRLGFDILSMPTLAEAVETSSRTGKGVASFAHGLLLQGKSIIVFKALYKGRYAPSGETERIDMFNGALAIETSAKQLLSGIFPASDNIKISLSQKNTGPDASSEYSLANGDRARMTSSILPPLRDQREVDLYGLPTQLEMTQEISLIDAHSYWALLTILASLIMYIAMLSTWHNFKTARVHEQELESYAARAAFSEENTDPIMRIDHQGRLLYSNDPGQKIVEEWNTVIGGMAPRNIIDFVGEVLGTNQYQEMEISINTTHYTLRFIPRRDQHYVNVYGRDDTEQKQSELALMEAKQAAEAASVAKSRFLATISHEVRTPMNGVLGMLELLLKTRLAEKQRNFAENALRSGKSLLGLINDILDFSKIESNKLKLERAPFSISGTVDDALQVVASDARRKNLRLITEIPQIRHQLIGDEQRLRQILINLIGNAVKFTDKGEVIIRLTKTAEYKTGIQLKFEISDTGIGIEPKALPYIFNDFTQQDDSTTRKFGGTGLGLAITKQLVNMMGGEIFAQSTPNMGSTFWITLKFETQLPDDRQLAEPTRTSPSSDPTAQDEIILNARILLAEDNAINQEVASAMLESAGCSVIVVEDGRQALAMFDREEFDLVLMDCQMPVMDGFEATRALRQLHTKNSKIPVIALTADIQQGIVQQCRTAGMDDYLSKPFTHESLVEIVAKWLPERACRHA